ncbi:HAD family hydrolase [Flavobacterium subsaxonicum]|uniref:ABC transporter ATP-binding protein n=1 Tax=Flavobacterium subsaxonicum WB 4.1-42 = DSM 21790 TaxID=1121898 RepID=A0A0A2MQC1_9FLAO|nr:HAD family hydrolase [Flavobacterium subsaxonicum]KGO94882.1 ABC transporter ATP-binding protein [Flavobacterium subsaxonicum WB 4.1-42 = DSM 21790]
MVNTVIFDMDGVIVDTEPVHYFAYHQHFKHLNIDIPDEMYHTFTGFSTKNTYQKIKDHFNLEEEIEALVRSKRDFFNDAFDIKEDLELLPGVLDLIKNLHTNGLQLVLASSASNETIARVFKRFNLHQYFTHIVSGEDFPQSKPHPAIFLKAAELSGNPVEQCIVIEDSTNGIKAANAAGIYCVAYKSANTKLQELSIAQMIIDDFSELNADIIRSIN